jgi:hypothetical protein
LNWTWTGFIRKASWEIERMKPPSQARSLRYEIKMECESALFSEAQAWIRLNSAAFREAYPDRQVNSLYLDTPALDTLNDHIEGIPTRRKLRFRWYGPDLEPARGQLELKNKTDRAGWKLVQPVNRPVHFRGCSWNAVQKDLAAGLLAEPESEQQRLFQELLSVARPLVMNQYQRQYYVSADQRLRLTVDRNIKAFDQWMSSSPNLSFGLPMPDILLIELKCDVEHARHLADVLAEFPLRVHRHSKYVSALSSLLER